MYNFDSFAKQSKGGHMPAKYVEMSVPYTPENLVLGLENCYLNAKARRQAINDIIKHFEELSQGQQIRFMAYLMRRGNENQKKKLGARVSELYGADCQLLEVDHKPWK